jgi:DNA-binding NtrC family response regulator
MTDPSALDRVLVVEDDTSLRRVITEVLDTYGYDVLTSPNGQQAIELLQKQAVDVVITDLAMPVMRGEALLGHVRGTFPEIPVIAITAFGSVESAVTLTRAGAADYLTKPFSTQALLDSVARVLRETHAKREQARTRRGQGAHLEGLVGRSQAMRHLFDRIARVAPSPAPLLITGETGTGKELVASAVHRASGRDPFLAVNCGAIPPNLIESELFGHARGAFTGAQRERAGLFEAADGGTLFLDEIAELPYPLQPKLLRVLQEGEVRRVGEVQSRRVRVRIIAATHRDLAAAVHDGTFREDLFYRINVLRVDVPALRERPADIPLLAERFLTNLAVREGGPELRISAAALAALVAYHWPGNVRELLNVIERAAIFADGSTIDLDDLPEDIRQLPPQPEAAPVQPLVRDAEDRALTLEQLEREYILTTLERAGGNRSLAAEMLGIPRRTLYRRLADYGILADR